MGFKQLCGEGGAFLRTGTDGNGFSDQIDVLAIDDEVAVVVECKSAVEVKGRSDVQEVIALLCQQRANVAIVLREANQGGPRIKVGGVLVLWNITPGNTDLQRAKEARVLILDATALEYYENLVEHTGSAARYQFLAEVFEDQTIDGLMGKVPAVEAKIGKNVA